MTPEEITTFDQARAVLAQHGLAVEKSSEPKIWLVGGSQRLDKGGVIQEARALLARKAQQESQTRPAPDRRWSSYAQAGNNALVPLREIRTDGGTQSRTAINRAKVAEYIEALADGAHFPPIVLFYDGSSYWLADGFHRVAAYQASGALDYALPGDVRQGTRRDAVLHACGANATHGLPRSTEDKENAVLTLLRDPEWSQWSYREIARRCHVSHDFVGKVAERHGLTGRASSQKTYTTRHGTTASMHTANIAAANTARAQEELAADPQPGEIHPLLAAVMEPAPAAPLTAPPGRGMPSTPAGIELPVQLLTTGWHISPPSGSSAFFVAHNAERGVSTHGFAELAQAISAAEHAQALIDDIEAQGWTIQRDLADPRRVRATHPHHPTITGAASLAALLHVLPAMRDHPATPAPAIGTTATTPEDTDIGDHLAALEAHGWRWHGATATAEGWMHLIADRHHADLARQRLTVAGIANLLRMFDQTGTRPTAAAAPSAPASDRPAPLVPRVLVLDVQANPYQVPDREILTVLFHTAEMVAARRPDDTTCKRRQERAYCLPDQDAQERVEAAFTRYQATLTAIAEHLRTLGTYESRLAAAGGIEQAPNPLTSTVIFAPAPDGYHAPSFDHGLKVPRADRSEVKEHTAKMLRIEHSPATISSQAGYFVCPDDAAWEHLQQLRAAATEAHAVLVELLAELGTYQQALADGRYGQQVAPPTARPEPAIPWSDLYRHTEVIRRQIGQRSQAGVIRAALDLLRLVAGPGQHVEARIAEIRVLLEQQINVPPNDEEHTP